MTLLALLAIAGVERPALPFITPAEIDAKVEARKAQLIEEQANRRLTFWALENADNLDYWKEGIPGEALVAFRDGYVRTQVVQSFLDQGAELVKERDYYVVVRLSDRSPEALRDFCIAAHDIPGVWFAEPRFMAYTQFTPNDTYWMDQWGPWAIYGTEAWDSTRGSKSVIAAVIDEGADYNHEDLTAQYGATKGTDIVNNDSDPMPPSGDEHGTHVSGTVAATMNNGIGVAGMADVTLYSVMVLQFGGGSMDDVADGVRWAADNGAHVGNMSLGGSSASSSLETAVNYAYDTMGTLLIAASGNSSGPIIYPARYSACVAVGAWDWNGSLAGFSCFGPEQEVVAPGVDIWSTLPNNQYIGTWDGTSMASPHVAGVAALMFSINTGLTAVDARSILTSTAIDAGSNGWDQTYGYGLVNAMTAVQTANANAAGGGAEETPPISFRGNPVRGSVSFQITAPGAERLSIYDVSGRLVKALSLSGNTARWDLTGSGGAKVSQGTYFAVVKTETGAATAKLIID